MINSHPTNHLPQYPNSLNQDHILYQIKQSNNLAESKNKCIPLKVKDSRQLSIKKAPLINKENIQLIDDGVLKMISCVQAGRLSQEKTMIIQNQKVEIEQLKQCLSAINNNKQARVREQQQGRMCQLTRLRQLERQYTQNLKQFDAMKVHLKDIKSRFKTALADKQVANQKYSHLLVQNEQLTQVINSLKSELHTTSRSHLEWGLEEQVAHLKEDLRQAQLITQTLQVKAQNYGKRMKQYQAKYNQLQKTQSHFQLNLYKLHQENQNLKIDSTQMQKKLNLLTNQLQTERQMHKEDIEKQKQKTIGDLSQKAAQNTNELSQLVQTLRQQNRNIKFQCSSHLEEYLKVKQLNRQVEQKWRQQVQEKRRVKEYFASLVNELQGKLDDKNRQLSEKEMQKEQISSKIADLQMKIHQGNEFLVQENKTLNSENRSLTGILTLHQQEIKDLQHQNHNMACIRQQIVQESQSRTLFLEQQLKKSQDQLRQKVEELEYYRSKYEAQLQKANQMCVNLKQLEQQNCNLTKRNAANVVEIGSLKAEVVVLRKQTQTLLEEEVHLQQESQFIKKDLEAKLIDLQGSLFRQNQNLESTNNHNKDMQNHIRCIQAELRQRNTQNATLRNQFQEIRKVMAAQSSHSQNTIRNMQINLQRAHQQLKVSGKQLREREEVIIKIKKELQIYATDVKILTRTVAQFQSKYSQLSQKHSKQTVEFEKLKAQWNRVVWDKMDKNRELQKSSISVCHQLDSSQTAVSILKKENQELQRIFETQIERRNATIRELVKQKKQLFQQLVSAGTLQ